MISPESVGDFTIPPLDKPIVYAEVREGHYLTAEAPERYGHLITLDLFTCKGIAIHDPASNRGALVHLNRSSHDSVTNYAELLEPVIDDFGVIAAADVSIVQAQVDENTALWPTSDTLAEFFMQHNPRSIRIDRNNKQLRARSIGLELATGAVYSLNYYSRFMWQSRQVLKASLPLRQTI